MWRRCVPDASRRGVGLLTVDERALNAAQLDCPTFQACMDSQPRCEKRNGADPSDRRWEGEAFHFHCLYSVKLKLPAQPETEETAKPCAKPVQNQDINIHIGSQEVSGGGGGRGGTCFT